MKAFSVFALLALLTAFPSFAQAILYFPGYAVPLVGRETGGAHFHINVNPASIYPPVTSVEAKRCYETSVNEIASFLRMPLVARSLKPLASMRQPFGGVFEVSQFPNEGGGNVRMRSSALIQISAAVNPRTHQCEAPDAGRISAMFTKFLAERHVDTPDLTGVSSPVAVLPPDWKRKYADVALVPYEPRHHASADASEAVTPDDRTH